MARMPSPSKISPCPLRSSATSRAKDRSILPPVGLAPHWAGRRSKLLRVALSLDFRGSDDAVFAVEGQGKLPAHRRLRRAPPVNNMQNTGEQWCPIIEIPLKRVPLHRRGTPDLESSASPGARAADHGFDF